MNLKVYLSLQILFAILTFVGFILLLMGKVKTAGILICCMVLSLMFKSFYDYSKNKS